MANWKCLQGNHEGTEVSNGWCQVHGPVKTKPLDDDAKTEANVTGAEEDRLAEEQRAKEAEERNQASIESGLK